MTDQQRADALGCVSDWMHTPHLDALARQGTRLAQMFAQSPVCVPSRCNFVSGRYPFAHRVGENNTLLPEGEPHLFRLLAAAGYQTGLIGKNHMLQHSDLEPLDFCFDEIGDADTPQWKEHLSAIRRDMSEKGAWAGARWHDLPENETKTHAIGAKTLEVLDEMAQGEAPFFLWCSFRDPHAPHTAPRRFNEWYPESGVPLPLNALQPRAITELEDKPSRQLIKHFAEQMDKAEEDDIRRYIAVYSAMVSYVDEWVGRILQRLDELGLRENTIVVFVSDHGDFRGEHGMVKKDLVLYDCLLHIPCIVRWPGTVAAGRVTSAMVEQIDLHPTLCEWAGVEVPSHVQGKSLATLLRGATSHHRDSIYAEACPPDYRNPYPDYESFADAWQASRSDDTHPLRWTANFNVPGDHCRMWRTRDWKYVRYITGEEELYDLATDPDEQHNLAASCPDKCRDFNELMNAWREQAARCVAAVCSENLPLAVASA